MRLNSPPPLDRDLLLAGDVENGIRLMDGDQVIAEYDYNDVSEDYDLARKFIYGPGIDEPICMIDVAGGGAIYYYHFDGLGSVTALSNVNRDIAE